MKLLKDTFHRYWRPINLYKRDREFYARHAQGPVSSRDIIEIEYGGAMPRGWTVKDKPHQHTPVEVKTPLTDPKSSIIAAILMSVMALGYVHREKRPEADIVSAPYRGQSRLMLNKLIFSPLGQGALLYLGYTVVKAATNILAQSSPLALLSRYPLLAMMAASSLRNQPLTQIFTLPFRPSMDTVGHENIHVLQNRDPYETKTGYNIFRNSFKERFNNAAQGGTFRSADSFISLGGASYFRHDFEIEARLNTLLTHKYAQWGRMPETRHEIWAALIDAGLRAPESIHRALAQSPEDLSDFRKSTFIGRIGSQLLLCHVAELNTAYWGLYARESREAYWHETLPYLYGHLTELCGDDRGLRKMGYTGPVTAQGVPVPLAPWDRTRFWDALRLRDDFNEQAATIHRMEALRGYNLRDHLPEGGGKGAGKNPAPPAHRPPAPGP